MLRFSSSKFISIAFGVLVLLFAVGFSVFAQWSPPGSAPPNGNTPTPLNTGTGNQTKTGGMLTVSNFWVNSALGVTGGATIGGNVGIGDTSPASLLSVGSGDLLQVNSSGDLVKIRNITYSWPSIQGLASTVLTNDGAGNLSWAAGGGGGSQWTTSGTSIYYNTGSVGIGTTSPADALHIAGGNNLRLGGASLNARLSLTSSGGSGGNRGTLIRQNGNAPLEIVSDGGTFQGVRITPTGSGPALELNPTANMVGIKMTGVAAQASDFLQISNSAGTNLVVVNNSGNVGIGTAAPASKLEVNGGVQLKTTTGIPTCTVSLRGTFWVVQSGAGVKDLVRVCLKSASDTYGWFTISSS